MATPGPQALAGFFVVDICSGVGGAFCTKLLADYGAEVIKLEPPSGDPLRHEGPFPGDAADGEAGALFLYLNTNKKSVVLDVETSYGADALRGLLRGAHLLVSDLAPAALSAVGLDFDSLHRQNPGLAMVSLSYFGESGPYSGWVGTNLTAFATGGQMAMTGDPEREPLLPGGYQADYQLGLNGFSAATIALYDAAITGEGQYCEVADIECMASTLEASLATYAYTGRNLWRGRRGNIPSSLMGIYPAADGYIGVHTMPRNWKALLETIGMPEMAEDPRFATAQARLQNDDELRARLYAWALSSDKRDAYDRAGEVRGPVAYVHDMADLFNSPQLRARDYLVEVDHPGAGRLTYPRGPFLMSETPSRAGRAPLLGEHTAEVLEAAAQHSPESREVAAAANPQVQAKPRLPLEGIRIIDLTAVWAGPYATRVLGDMGAEVIKVEGAANPDMLRSLAMLAEPDPRSYNKSAYFNHNNRDKLGCSIDLTKPGGVKLLLELVKVSDVIIENFRADVMDRFGLGYDALKRVKPDIVYVSMPGHGKSGPEAHHIAYGTHVEQLAGLVSITGYPGEGPHKSGISYGDPTAGTLAAGAVVAALLYRRRTGNGQYVEIAQRESLTNLIGEFVVAYSMNGRIPERLGNRHRSMAPHGCYPAVGEDQWVTIACRDDADFAALTEAIGQPELAAEARFATAPERLRHQDELDSLISDWTARQEKYAIVDRLQAAGIPSAPVLLHTELLTDPHLAARGFFERPPHPEAGEWPMEGPVFHFQASQPHLRRNAPCFAEHNDYVFKQLLGLSDSELSGLSSEGVIATEPNMGGHL